MDTQQYSVRRRTPVDALRDELVREIELARAALVSAEGRLAAFDAATPGTLEFAARRSSEHMRLFAELDAHIVTRGDVVEGAGHRPRGISREVRELIGQAVRAGWTFSMGRKHGRLTSPEGRRITVPCTPSDWRSTRNLRAQLRRAGLQ